ncbi:hypothetical protein Bca52824_013416 [Brassica carinata]|uniref:SHSP domain-containing protein n=1 Tax=Brassica carinata TaxID=52824 RepID=A0A8X7W0S0_BRACI|nr:hypothetical protein Bca52824_013416 [Brassica carinata]
MELDSITARRRLATVAAHFPSSANDPISAASLVPLNCSSSLNSVIRSCDNKIAFARQASSEQGFFMRQASTDQFTPQPGAITLKSSVIRRGDSRLCFARQASSAQGLFMRQASTDEERTIPQEAASTKSFAIPSSTEQPLVSRPEYAPPQFSKAAAKEEFFVLSDLLNQPKENLEKPYNPDLPKLANPGTVWSPRSNVSEYEHNYVVAVELPGASINDIRVEVDNSNLTVTGRRTAVCQKVDAGTKGSICGYHKQEILQGPFNFQMASSSACLLGNGLSVHANKQRSKQFRLSSTSASVNRTSKVTVVKASLDVNKHEARRGFFKLLLGNAAAAGVSLLGSGNANAADEQEVSSSRMSYSRFLEYLDKGRVDKVDLYENGTIAIVEAVSPELGNRIQRVRVQLPGLSQELLQKLRAKNIDFASHNAQEDQGSPLLNLIGNLAFPVILICGLFLLSRRSSGGMGGPGGPGFPLQIGQSKAKFQMEPNTGVTFDDVAGVDEAKQDFMEVVEFLKKPERFTAVGARIPKGVLLVGPPGTGKTLLAKAIAGEAGVPFFSISGSEFVEMFVGVGASRVRDLFKKAKENAPCIVFVDEIDAVGRQRGTGIGGGNDEREQTLNQLLTEMDGFEGNTGVIVVAATNRADILDSALLRPGRFDRQVSVDVPDVKGRTDILKVHSGNKKFENGVSLEVIAMRTPGFSGADLANLLNEAAILAGRRGKTAISSKEIDDSIDRIVAGMEGTVMTDGKSKSLVAYHEVGHAVCGTLTPGHDAVQKVTLIPRGQARGLTWFIPSDDPTLISKQQLFARIVGGLGGRAAEEVIFGESEVTTGAVGDLQQITGLAKQMVTTFGMSEIGPWSLMDSSAQSDVIMRMMARNSMSEKLANDIDTAVKTLSDKAYEIALGHIRNNREAMDKIVEVLLEKETMSGDEFRAILSEFTEIPPENRVASSSTSTSTPTPASV